jgi:hypothetical protein
MRNAGFIAFFASSMRTDGFLGSVVRRAALYNLIQSKCSGMGRKTAKSQSDLISLTRPSSRVESFDGRAGRLKVLWPRAYCHALPLPGSSPLSVMPSFAWQHVYKAAVLEHDPKKLEDLIQCAFTAIYEPLGARGDITAEESEGLSAALHALEHLQESKRDQCRPPHEVWLSSRSPMPGSPGFSHLLHHREFALNRRCLDAVLETIKFFRVAIGHAFPCTPL